MDTPQIQQALQRLFQHEQQRIVFWHDPKREFEETLPTLDLNGVKLLRLDETPALQIKVTLEHDDPDGQYLLYAPFDPPAPEHDWLLDIRLYGHSFHADRAAIVLDELGLRHQQLREHLAARAAFFASRERLQRLKKWIDADDDALAVDSKILAQLARAEQPDFFTTLTALFDAIPHYDPDALPPTWTEIDKYGVADTFWQLAETHFGYSEETPSLKNLLIRLLVSDFAQTLSGSLPDGLRNLLLPDFGAANAVVLLAQWRDSSRRGASYEALSAAVADAIRLDTFPRVSVLFGRLQLVRAAGISGTSYLRLSASSVILVCTPPM
jgi:hypothetical protein